jgi:uncharacterized protein (TIGR00369 family)
MSEPPRLDGFLERVPYARFLGMQIERDGDDILGLLPFAQHLIGNPVLPALHGGVIGAFMEMTALAQLALAQPERRVPKTIDVTIEYLRPGRPILTHARAEVRKAGRRVANVHVEAWQEARAQPIAFLHGHFLVSS